VICRISTGNEKQEVKGALEEKKEARENDCAEHIDRIPNERVDAAGDQMSRLRRERKGIAMLDARDGQEDEGRGHED